jgi:aquaporin Z
MSEMSRQNRIACAEAIGTLILVGGGAGTAVLATGGFLTTNSVGELGVAIAFGLSLLCAAYAIGSISGCHVNPAVTAGMWALGKTKSRDVPYYVVGQVVGGIVGAAVIYAIAHSQTGFDAKGNGFASNGYGAHSPGGFKLPAVILTEIIFTALFVFVIASTSRKSMSPGFTGVAMGLMLTVIHLITIPVDNTSVNPARSIATAVVQHGWALGQLWVFIVFPIVGGMLGGYTWKALVPAEDA